MVVVVVVGVVEVVVDVVVDVVVAPPNEDPAGPPMAGGGAGAGWGAAVEVVSDGTEPDDRGAAVDPVGVMPALPDPAAAVAEETAKKTATRPNQA